MPSIMPISELRNYTEVLKEVDNKSRVYLTRNGRGAYAIMTVAEADELDRIKSMRALSDDLKRAEERAKNEGWIDADKFDREMGIID
ncbi:MAG: type II toxin-antitoxin system prevent-host-death family antitoxin [Lachnospiraceae bacterium]|nr:type II toxin-antitoxin system prevent-host-death family antitoxin [Lachnospiraceae bacterium]